MVKRLSAHGRRIAIPLGLWPGLIRESVMRKTVLTGVVRLGSTCGLAALLLSTPLAPPAAAQDGASQPGAAWQDPPARLPPTPAAKAPKTETRERPVAEAKPKARKVVREVRAPRRVRVSERRETSRRIETVRPAHTRRVAMTPRGSVVAQYPAYAGPPVVYGRTLEDERLARIRAAQAAGYIVVRSRSVEFPDGRSLRTYRPYEDEED